MLYLHEVIDIVGTGQEAYLNTVGERAAHSEREGLSRLMGTWKVIGSTNRWPRVVNLWEMDGWEQWAETLERQFLPEKKDPELAPWWAKATQWRRGGFDRILEPTLYSPTRDQLRARKLAAWVCVHTIVRLMPGRRDEYLAAVGNTLRTLLEARGLVLMGAYSAPMRSDEAVILWAAPDFRTLCAVYQNRTDDAAIAEWTTHVRPLRRKFDTMWLVPSTHCFFHPQHVGSGQPVGTRSAKTPPRRAGQAKGAGNANTRGRRRGLKPPAESTRP